MKMKKYTLKDLLVIKNGRDYKNLKRGNYPLYGTGGIMAYVDGFLYKEDSILLPRKGSLKNIMYVDRPFWTVDTMYWTIVNKDIVDPRYLYLYLSLLDLSSKDSGSTLPSMTFASYYSIPLDLPEILVQKKYSKAIFNINNKIALNNRINDNL